MSMTKRCHKCAAEWHNEKRQPGVKECCEKCSAYLHCCLNCRFHDRSAHNECYIPNTDWVGDKRRANFCDQFEFADKEVDTGGDSKKDQAKEAFDALLGGSEAHSKEASRWNHFGIGCGSRTTFRHTHFAGRYFSKRNLC